MEFKLPEIGEGLQEGELVQWLVKPGDTVETDQPLLEVMTDKATVEVPATEPGVISKLHAKEGDMIKVGQAIATIDRRQAEENATKEAPKTKEKPVDNGNGSGKGYGIFAEEKTTPTSTKKEEAPKSTPNPKEAQSSTANQVGEYQQATQSLTPASAPAAPIVRSMAAKAGINLDAIKGSGPLVGGVPRVLESDLLSYINANKESSSKGTPISKGKNDLQTPVSKAIPTRVVSVGEEAVERVPLRGLRRVISNAMSKSKFTAPHYTYVDEFECSELIELRTQAKELAAEYGVSFSYLPFIIKAVVGALKEFPIVNSSLEEDAEGNASIVYKKFYHIGFAVATDEGLIVPVIKNADQKNMLQIAQEIHELADKTRRGKATADELRGSTFTITSMGNLGGLFATPIINYPEVGILGVYKAQQRPIVKDGQIVVGNMMTLSLSLDHRVVDGAVGSRFCSAIIERLSAPARLLMELV